MCLKIKCNCQLVLNSKQKNENFGFFSKIQTFIFFNPEFLPYIILYNSHLKPFKIFVDNKK